MKSIFKKLISGMLAIIMSFGMFPLNSLPVLAASGPADGQVEYIGGTTSATGKYDIEVSKTIEAISGRENYFDITLKTTTHKHPVDMSTDVVIVLDISNTMNSDASGNEGATNAKKKITFAKNATNAFIKAFCTNENLDTDRKISVVTFNRDAKVAVSLREANDTADYNAISKIVSDITAPSGQQVKWTNIEAGLRLANNVLSSSTAKYKYVVLLTDGFPTTYLKNHSASGTGTLSGYTPIMEEGYKENQINNDGYFANTRTKQPCTGGTSYSNRAAEYAESAAKNLKNNNINIFTVGVALASQNINNFLTYIIDTTGMTANEKYAIGNNESTYKNWLENEIAGGPVLDSTDGAKYSDAYDQEQLENDYDAILKAIELAPETTLRTFGTTDPMSGIADFMGFYDKNGKLVSGNLSGESKENAENTASYNSSTETITWNKMLSGFRMEGANYVYTLKYRIRLENEQSGFSFASAYNTNGRTVLSYSQKYQDGSDVEGGTGTLDYKIPQIEGYKGSLRFQKIDSGNNQPIAGVNFTLQHYGNSCSVCSGDANIADVVKTSAADGYVSFENIPSGHEYRLIEEVPAGYAPIHNHTIIVSYGKTYLGTISAENEIVDGKRNGGTGELFQVKNTKVESPEISFSVKKAVENLGTLSGGEYSFLLSGVGVNNVQFHEIKTNDANGNVVFDKMIFDIPGTYNFTVSEIIGTDGATVYDPAKYDISVVVTHNTDKTVTSADISVNGTSLGTFVGDIDEDTRIVNLTGENASFTNKKRAGTEIVLEAKKTFEGLSAEQFEFQLTDESGALLQTRSNAADGSVTFDKITFTEPGTYKYYIKEVLGTDKSVAYDDTVYTATVKVTAPSDLTDEGALSAAVTYSTDDGSAPEFINKKKTIPSIVVEGYKSFDGAAAAADKFTFVLEEISVSQSGSEENPTYGYTVKPGTSAEFKNDENGIISFTDRLNAEIAEMVNDINGSENFSSVRYYKISEKAGTEAGILYDEKVYILIINLTTAAESENYLLDVSVHEESGSSVFSRFGAINVEIKAKEIYFENKSVADTELVVRKVLVSENASAQTEAFSFVLVDEAGNRTEKSITGSGETKFPFTFTADDIGTHKYTIYEVKGSNPALFYDDSVYSVEITVEKDSNGILYTDIQISDAENHTLNGGVITFTNKDLDPTHLHLSAEKYVNGELPNASQKFSFELIKTDAEGNKTETIETKTNSLNKVTFSELHFTETGTYYYAVKEVLPEDEDAIADGIQNSGFTYDQSVHYIKVTVTEKEGALEKTIELNGKTVTAENNTLPVGSFNNLYAADPVSVNFEGTKTLAGKQLESGVFSFLLTTADGSPLPAVTEVTADANGKFSFEPITFETAGTYEYQISEKKGSLGGITYDETVYDITVKVTDNGKGNLEAAVTVNGKAYDPSVIAFENVYEVTPVSIRFTADKALTGRNLEREEFSFRLVEIDSEGNEISGTEQIVFNGTYQLNSSVYFNFIEFNEAGTYRYKISEVLPEDDDSETPGIQKNGVTYSEASYTVTVEVEDDGEGNLVVKIGEKIIERVHHVGTFTNSYSYKEVAVNPEVMKVLYGRNWNNNDSFTFIVAPSDDDTRKAIDEKTVVITDERAYVNFDSPDHKATFDDIVFHAPGTYRFTVTEENSGSPLVEYDDHALNITVTVTDDLGGNLVASMAYFGYTTFTNVYKPLAIEVVFEGTKELAGRNLVDGEFSFVLRDSEGNDIETVTSDADGKIAFSPIEYFTAGTYNYTVSEVPGNLSGVTYDETVFNVTVDVTYDRDTGEFSSETSINGGAASEFVFKNGYVPAPTDAYVEGTKSLTDDINSGRTIKAGEFRFAINPDESNPEDDPISFSKDITNDADGKIVFIDAEYKTAGTYIYTVNEVDNEIPGMNYDTSLYRITVTVTDDEKGNLHSDVKTEKIGTSLTASEIEFENIYDPSDTTATIHGHKFLTGDHKNLEADDFTFTLTEVDEDGKPVENGHTDETTNRSTGIYQFDAIHYDEIGTYYYQIAEVKGSDAGYTYDETVHTVTVTVEDDGKGALVAYISDSSITVTGYENYSNVFVNSYVPSGTSAQLYAVKELDNGGFDRNLEADEFTFVLIDAYDNILQEKTNDTNGLAEFDQILYSKAGTYTYTISEKSGNLNGITYDTSIYVATVTVTDNGGSLSAEVSYSKDEQIFNEAVFLNTYAPEPVSVTFEGTKVLNNEGFEDRKLLDGEFGFVLSAKDGAPLPAETNTSAAANGGFSFGEIVYDEPGTYVYTVSEEKGTLGGVAYDETVYTVTVEVTDENGILEAKVSYSNGENSASGIVFENRYTAEPVRLVFEAEKTLSGRDLKAGEFSFELKDGDGKVLQTIRNDDGGQVIFDEIEITEAGTYSFNISEVINNLKGVTYDTTVYSVIINVTDDLEGSLVASISGNEIDVEHYVGSFGNIFVPDPVKVNLSGTKILDNEGFEDRKLLEGEFEFIISAITEGAPLPAETTVANKADGTFVFGDIFFDEAGTYQYSIREKSGTLGGITYDDTVITATVTVTYDSQTGLFSVSSVDYSESELRFTNKYEADPTFAVIMGNKTLTGRDLNTGEFSFVLKDSEGNEIETVTNGADGSFAFARIDYNKSGTYTYTVSESKGELGGVTYDETVYTVTVEVTDNLEGKLESNVTYLAENQSKDLAEFSNAYNTIPVEVEFGGTKELTGRELEAGEFTFVLKNASGETVETVSNLKNGSFSFGKIVYDEPGTYVYTVSEVKGTLGGVTYDETVYTVRVTVTDDLEGNLVAVTEITSEGTAKDSIVFRNSYRARPVEVEFDADKKYHGRKLKDDMFTFVLVDEEGNIIETVKNKANGDIDFSTIRYTEAGTYRYKVYEKIFRSDSIRFDTSVYEVTVVVTEDFKNGILTAEVTYYKKGKEVNKITFQNLYDPPEDPGDINPGTGAPVI